jgi:hypothetical protein
VIFQIERIPMTASVLRPPSLAIDAERGWTISRRSRRSRRTFRNGGSPPRPTSLFGALAEAHGFVKDADSLALWKSRCEELFDEIEQLDTKTRGQSGIRVIGLTT